MDKVFLPNQTKKKKSGLHTGFNNGHLLDRKQKFFYGGQWDPYWRGYASHDLEIYSHNIIDAHWWITPII